MPDSLDFQIGELAARLNAMEDQRYLEFLRVADLNAGLRIVEDLTVRVVFAASGDRATWRSLDIPLGSD